MDIDPFAVNIARLRLRLWLSLAVDFEGDTPPPLPNLDFKIEVGDSLTAPDPSGGLQPDLFRQQQIEEFLRSKADYLMAHGSEKLALRERIAAQREQIAAWARPHRPGLSEKPGLSAVGFDWAVEFAEVFADGGFHIVVANPPYVRADAQFKHVTDEAARQAEIARWKQYRADLKRSGIYETLYEKWDLYIPFLERAHQLLRPGGQMVYIIPDAYNAAKYAEKSHAFFLEKDCIERIDFCSDIPLFDAGVSNTILHFSRRAPGAAHVPGRYCRWGERADDFEDNVQVLPTASQAQFGSVLFRSATQLKHGATIAVAVLESLCFITVGMVINADEREIQGAFGAEDVLSDTPDDVHLKQFVLGKDVVRWAVRNIRYIEWGTWRAPALFRRPTFPELHDAGMKLLSVRTPGATPKVVYDEDRLHFDASTVGFVPWHLLAGVVNRSIDKTTQYRYQDPSGDCEERERVSAQFNLKYILAIMNSAFARDWLAQRRRSKLHIYPDDWKQLPIAHISLEAQQPFVQRVDAILAEFAAPGHPLPVDAAARVSALEKELDEMVAGLYTAAPEGAKG